MKRMHAWSFFWSSRAAAPLLAALAGLLGLTAVPVLALPALWAWLLHAAEADTSRRMFVGGATFCGVYLWWMAVLLSEIFGSLIFAPLVLPLFALIGVFFGLLGAVAARASTPARRLAVLVGGWVWLEWLRGLGPLAFPWPQVAAFTLDTPFVQGAAVLGGLGVALFALLPALSFARKNAFHRMIFCLPILLMGAFAFTVKAGDGPPVSAWVVRSDVGGWDRIGLDAETQFARLHALTESRPAGAVAIWPESVVQLDVGLIERFAGDGIVGTGGIWSPENSVSAIQNGVILEKNHKARPVPFGETMPLHEVLRPFYEVLQSVIGMHLAHLPPAETMRVLPLGGVLYGAYICYDSIFAWPARQLTQKGAEVLVTVSNDSWFVSAGVEQHFQMGRLRAIENRRWVLRSAQRGVAGAVDDLGRVQARVDHGEGALPVTAKRLDGRSPYSRWGDAPALALSAAIVALALFFPSLKKD